jgi:hypothetical protein
MVMLQLRLIFVLHCNPPTMVFTELMQQPTHTAWSGMGITSPLSTLLIAPPRCRVAQLVTHVLHALMPVAVMVEKEDTTATSVATVEMFVLTLFPRHFSLSIHMRVYTSIGI